MTKMTILGAAIAAMTLTACGQNNVDPLNAVVRNGPQTQSPIADAPNGKLPTGGANAGGSAATPVIIDDSAPAAAGGSIFEFRS